MIEAISNTDLESFEEIRRECVWNGRMVKVLTSDSITISITWKFIQSNKPYKM